MLYDRRAKELDMFSLMTKMLRSDLRAVFKYLEGCHMGEGQMCCAGAQTTELALITDENDHLFSFT